MKWLKTAAVLALFATVCAARADELQNCRQIEDAAQRLRCYDANTSGQPASITSDTATPAAVSNEHPESIPAPTAPVPAAIVSSTDNFGFENRPKPKDQQAPDSIETRLMGDFSGWVPNQKFTFENGQVWQVVDNSEAYYRMKDPKVIIERGVFGALFLQFGDAHRRPRVKRIK